MHASLASRPQAFALAGAVAISAAFSASVLVSQPPALPLPEGPSGGDVARLPAAASAEPADAEPFDLPAEVPPPPPVRARRDEELAGRIGRGQTLASALRAQGIPSTAVHEIVQALSPHYDFRRAPADSCWEVRRRDGRVQRFCFRPDALMTLEAERGADGILAGRKIEADLQVVEAEIAATITTSLYQAIRDAGESPTLVSLVADVFAWDLDFSRDQQPGDRFRMIVEKVHRGDTFVRYGRVLAAEYVGRRGSHRAFWFEPAGERGHYYLEDGRSAEKTFLASPVEFTRVSSRFSRSRRHPILGYSRAHNGTDFAAPRGTPVRSLADGRVIFAGRRGGSGKLVIVRHENGLQSYYAHLDRIERGIRAGVQVRQKQQIGRVGSTGLATGPHLHLGIKRNGHWIDPQRLEIRRNDPVPEQHRAAFARLVESRRTRLAALGTAVGTRLVASRSTAPEPVLAAELP